MSRDLTFAELLAANRAYRTALCELVGLVLAQRLALAPARAEVLARAQAALDRFQ